MAAEHGAAESEVTYIWVVMGFWALPGFWVSLFLILIFGNLRGFGIRHSVVSKYSAEPHSTVNLPRENY